MKKRYQVFVSSTFLDLQEERHEVMQALLELNCIPAGMELFPAASDDQWTLIKNVIDDCDYYLVIIGGRYGTIGPAGMSYTEMEYRYALEQGKPIIAFVYPDPGMLPANQTEPMPEGREKLERFRTLVQQKMVRFWKSPSDLGSVVSRSLVQLILTVPATGWIRADQVPTRDTADPSSLDKIKRKASPTDSFKWDSTGNLYWLGHDLMWTMAALRYIGTRESALHGLRQCHHHLCEIGMNESPYARRLVRWLKEVETISGHEWTLDRRYSLASEIDRLTDQIGALAETRQSGYRADPED
jgi:Domain of unknown function (DUF4062)